MLGAGAQPPLRPLLFDLEAGSKLRWPRTYPASGDGELGRIVPLPDGLLLAGASAGTWVTRADICGTLDCGAPPCKP